MSEEKQATPHAELMAQLLDSRVPKTEREHAASREIERLRAEVAALREDALRYRWLRDGCCDKGTEASRIAKSEYGMDWDAAIDAARAKGGA